MTPHHSRSTPSRSIAPVHRGPNATPSPAAGAPLPHSPNAALLIDFDNVTMGIRSDLQTELRNLLSSDIIKGKVSIQRAYADWRRYPQYIVPLTESSIDLIYAPAYGSSKKNATDIRLAINAMELVFTRPEIGTIILLSGDSDFSSLVIKLKEYSKYVIGVGIRESSSELLVMNCDEYYSYNALAGLVKSSEEEVVKRDPWDLVTEAIDRMKRNGDVMRSDRLKQVMQEIDNSFDEKTAGYAKFSKFCLDAAQKGLLTVSKMDNGQLEVDVPSGSTVAKAAPSTEAARPAVADGQPQPSERRGRRGGRGRGRDRAPRANAAPSPAAGTAPQVETQTPPATPVAATAAVVAAPSPRATPSPAKPVAAASRDQIGESGERLTRIEAFDLVRRAVAALVTGDGAARASDIRRKAFELLGRDSDSLADRNFGRILRDAHDADVVDLRRRGDDFEVALAVRAAPVAEQVAQAEAANTPVVVPAVQARGMAPRGLGMTRGRRGGPPGRGEAPPPGLFSVGVVAPKVAPAPEPVAALAPAPAERPSRAKAKKGTTTAKKKAAPSPAAVAATETPPAKPKAKRPPPRARKRGGTGASE